jgi:CHAT domain-containing protein
VLTAEEIAALDLSGLDWAVLSACETGVGDVLAGDGVFGLQRAFQVAGARTVVTSLWAVDDAATRAWMDQFCRARLVLGRPTADAVRDASLALLRERRRTGQGSHPFYRAGFVATGDWR